VVSGIILAIRIRGERVLPNVEVAPTSGGGVATIDWQF
jgi:hypothetical protein